MEKNTCEFIGNCPTLKTLDEATKRETEARVGSMNFYVSSSDALRFIKKEFCCPYNPGDDSKNVGNIECPTYTHINFLLCLRS